jgi:hypothetical protein
VADDQSPAQDSPVFHSTGGLTLPQLIDYLAESITDPERLKRVEGMLATATARAGGAVDAVAVKGLAPLVETFAVPIATVILKVLFAALETMEPLTDEIGKLALDAVVGDRPRRGYIPDDVGRRVLDRLAPSGGVVEPGIENAQHFVAMMVNLQLEPWLMGVAAEVFGDALDMLRGAGGALHSVAELREIVAQVFGGGRVMRRVLSPFIDDGIVTPAKWHTSKQYRPQLLGSGDAIRHYLRGRWSIEQLREELARQGWSDERIDALVSNATKRLTIDQLLFLQWRGAITDQQLVTAARDLGYDGDTAAQLIEIENTQRLDRAKAPILDAAIAAYVAGNIDEPALSQWIGTSAPTQADQVYELSAARARRQLRQQPLSAAEVRRLTLKGVLAVSDYRRALERENFAPDAVTALELELRIDLDAAGDVEKARTAQAAQRAADRAAADADRAQREADLAARKALPTLQEYRRAYVRGLLTRDTFAAALTREKVAIAASDLALLLADADADREKYLADQEHRTAAIAAGDSPRLSIGTLEQAVLSNVLTLPEFDARLAQSNIPDPDRRVLVELLQSKIAARDEATAQRAAAAERATRAGVSLSVFERAVRLGVRTIDQYAAWLDTIGTPDVAKALILELLQQQLTADAAARARRDATDQAPAVAGLSLAQRRRAYVAGVRPRAYYADALAAAGWSIDDRDVELSLADAEADQAAAARARRDAIDAETQSASVTLGQMQRAVTLGLATPDELRDYLAARGYSDADAQLIVDLVLADIPNVRAGQQLESRIAGELAEKGVVLADRKALVRRGLWTLDQYTGALQADGYSDDDAALLAQLLSEQIAVDFAGLRAKVTKSLAAGDGAPTIDDVDAAFAAGEIDAAGVRDALLMYGVPQDSATLYARLLPDFGEQG